MLVFNLIKNLQSGITTTNEREWDMNRSYLSIYLSIRPSIHQYINPSIHHSITPSIHQSIYLSIYLSIYPSIHLSINLSIHQSFNLYIYLSIHLSSHSYLCIYPTSWKLYTLIKDSLHRFANFTMVGGCAVVFWWITPLIDLQCMRVWY